MALPSTGSRVSRCALCNQIQMTISGEQMRILSKLLHFNLCLILTPLSSEFYGNLFCWISNLSVYKWKKGCTEPYDLT